jgi:hypothetical protein
MNPEPVAPEYVAARRALLDVLDILESQRHGLILVGAQAVYLQAPANGAERATYTTDGDLAIDPDLLSEDPDIGEVLTAAGYERLPNPGAFRTPAGIEIDLMVPEGAVPPSRHRSVELAGQSRFTARRTAGLEVALLDSDLMTIPPLDETDGRDAVQLRVAGAAALTVAKLIKLEERLRQGGDRVIAKDAADLLRLLRYCGATTIGQRLRSLAPDDLAAASIERSISFLRQDLAARSSELARLAVEGRGDDETDAQVAEAMVELCRRTVSAFDAT